MRYISTRGQAPVLDFEGVLLAGLAEDGGLVRARRMAAAQRPGAARPARPGLRRNGLSRHLALRTRPH